jgi:hypothetical protein
LSTPFFGAMSVGRGINRDISNSLWHCRLPARKNQGPGFPHRFAQPYPKSKVHVLAEPSKALDSRNNLRHVCI